ncbi:MAG: leucyl aminopeptidase family protein, partial [Acidobacteriota bacterium]|nr:leucyl aminopeptidase family protein [Acidobacteriota bacterium]
MSALPIHASLDIKAASSADAIAVSYSKNSDGNFEFVSPLTADIEKFFGVDLVDELSFFSPTGKAGELFEIPVSAPDAATDRLFLLSVGDQSGASMRAAGAAIGRKVRGKSTTVYSACAAKDPRGHAISMALGAWVWN